VDASDGSRECTAQSEREPNIWGGQAMEDAGPFLDAVDASEVPDYYDVIKVPLRVHPGCPQRLHVRRGRRMRRGSGVGAQPTLHEIICCFFAHELAWSELSWRRAGLVQVDPTACAERRCLTHTHTRMSVCKSLSLHPSLRGPPAAARRRLQGSGHAVNTCRSACACCSAPYTLYPEPGANPGL